MKVRTAVPDDAPAMGRVMVETWLTAHRGQMPAAAWQKRVDEWTPEVSARGWARVLAERTRGEGPGVVLLVAEDEAGRLVGLVFGAQAEGDASGSTIDIGSLYVLPDHQGQGVGRQLMQVAATEAAALGFSSLEVGVLTANLPARRFYEAMGGREVGTRSFDEDGFLLPETVYAWPELPAGRTDVEESFAEFHEQFQALRAESHDRPLTQDEHWPARHPARALAWAWRHRSSASLRLRVEQPRTKSVRFAG